VGYLGDSVITGVLRQCWGHGWVGKGQGITGKQKRPSVIGRHYTIQ